jgi:hypothetical protein
MKDKMVMKEMVVEKAPACRELPMLDLKCANALATISYSYSHSPHNDAHSKT